MRAAIAVRVSPRPQENVRYSPEIQEQTCREWCDKEGHEVVTVVRDILVSGGSSSRFDSIFEAMEQHSPQLFVVSDLSRWTRDRPSRFWAIKALLEDRGVQLVSVAEPWVDNGQPFGDTITTAVVEGNYQERMRLKAKTSQGVRKAWAAGKRWGHPWGWTWDGREWHQDTDLIKRFYADWIAGVSGYEMAARYGVFETNIRQRIGAVSQRDVVGAETWDLAQVCRPFRGARRDSIRSSIYRGLLVCPFCGGTLQHATHWGHYKCHRYQMSPHGWWSVSARKYVTPTVQAFLSTLRSPDSTLTPPAAPRVSEGASQAELDRLTMAWVKGRLSDERYEKAVSEIERRMKQHTPQVEAPPDLPEFVRDLSFLDLEDRHPESGNAANLVLRKLIERIDISEERAATVVPFPWVTELWGITI